MRGHGDLLFGADTYPVHSIRPLRASGSWCARSCLPCVRPFMVDFSNRRKPNRTYPPLSPGFYFPGWYRERKSKKLGEVFRNLPHPG